MLNRYQNLVTVLDRLAARGTTHLRYLEVGTYDGARTEKLLRHWLAGDKVRSAAYWGFDLWEELTPEMSKAELSKSRLPPNESEVLKRLSGVPQCAIQLFKGNTRKTMPEICPGLPGPMGLIFVDGGHSLDSVASDWRSVRHLIGEGTTVLFDDYYENRLDYGCKRLVDKLTDVKWATTYKVRKLDPVDDGADGLKIRMIEVTQA